MNDRLLGNCYHTLWCQLLVTELVRLGVNKFYLTPGYRSLPLIAALHAESGADKVICFDERSASFRALGYYKGSGKVAALVCTSGTAAANYYPAVIEAAKDHIPLIILTADRPFEAIASGANQVIDQTQLFSAFVRKSLNFPAASSEIEPNALLTHIAMMVRLALSYPAGPVHINLPFREPLEPSHESLVSPAYRAKAAAALLKNPSNQASTTARMFIAPTGDELDIIGGLISSARHGLLIIGRLDPGCNHKLILELITKLQWPVYLDITSSLKGMGGELELVDLDQKAGAKLLDEYAPDVVLRLGRSLVSKHYDKWIFRHSWTHYAVVNARDDIQDVTHQLTLRLIASEGLFCEQILARKLLASSPRTKRGVKLITHMTSLKEKLHGQLANADFSLHRLAFDIWHNIDETALLFLGNSLTIRGFDKVGSIATSRNQPITAIANRGVSGIEGLLSTAIGLAEGTHCPIVAVLGDISMLHDLNSLLESGKLTTPFCVIVINNQGGEIFRRLPVANYPDILDPYLINPHTYKFECVAEMAQISYVAVSDNAAFALAFSKWSQAGGVTLIECTIPRGIDGSIAEMLNNNGM